MTIQKQAEETPGFKKILGPLLFLAVIFFLNFSARILFAPLMPVIEAELNISHQEAGSFFLMIAVGYCVALFGSSFFLSKLTHRTIIVCSALAVGLVLMGLAFLKNMLVLRCGLFILGMATGIYLPSGIATITSLAPSQIWGRALAVHELAPNMGFFLVPLMAQALLGFFPWRTVIFLFGIMCLIISLAFWRFGKGGRLYGTQPSIKAYTAIFKEPSFWLMMVLFSMGITGTMGIYNMFPLYLVKERGFDKSTANYWLGFSRIISPAMAFVGGWAIDHFGPKKTLFSVFLFSGFFAVLLGLVPGQWVILVLFMQSMAAVCFFPAGFAILSAIGRPESRNMVVSMAIPLAFVVGSGVIPTLIGWIGDVTHSFALGISLAGGFILCGVLVASCLRLPEKRME
jgi:NNP family nitrate/nitrite transporter-like MFS transporter